VNKRPSVEEREQITARVRVSLELMIPYPASMILGIEIRVMARPECR
jgi:hypothetical protein